MSKNRNIVASFDFIPEYKLTNKTKGGGTISGVDLEMLTLYKGQTYDVLINFPPHFVEYNGPFGQMKGGEDTLKFIFSDINYPFPEEPITDNQEPYFGIYSKNKREITTPILR